MEAQAERRAAVPAACAVLGVPPAAGHRAPDGPVPPGQGPTHGLQGQAGLRDLPRPRTARRPEEARAQGALVSLLEESTAPPASA